MNRQHDMSSPLYCIFLLQLLMQSHSPGSRQILQRRNKDVSFSCVWAHVTHCEFASHPNLCSGKRAVIRFESAIEKGRRRGGSLSWCNKSCSSPLLPPLSIPLLQFEWKDYSQKKMTFNLKIVSISLIPPPPFSPTTSPLSSLLPLLWDDYRNVSV